MIVMNYQDINQPLFETALTKLANSPALGAKTAYNVAKISEQLFTELRLAKAKYRVLIANYCELDGSGKPKFDGKDLVYKTGCKEKFNKELDAFLKTSFTIERFKILVSQITEVKLTPAEVLTLEPILSELELVQNPDPTLDPVPA